MSRPRIACFGELLLRLGAPGHHLLLQVPQLEASFGGAEGNVAIALAQFKHSVAMITALPDNPLGTAALGELRRYGVDVQGVQRNAGRMGLYFLTTGSGHRPSEIIYDRAGSAFASTPAASYDWPHLLDGVDWLHLSGINPALGPEVAQASVAAARAACERGARVSFDGNFRPSLWQQWGGDARAILHDLFDCAWLVFADERDISVVLDVTFPQSSAQHRVEAAAGLGFAAFPRLHYLACTQRRVHHAHHHALGAMLLGRDGTQALAAEVELPNIVDRIGSGDAFAAGVIHGVLEGLSAEQTVRFGLAAACLKHSIPGDVSRMQVADVLAVMDGAGRDVRR